MPSQARLTFERNLLKDVHRLIAAHKAHHKGKGKPLSVFTRSGVFLLSAAWELYIEEAAKELVECLVGWAGNPKDLSVAVQENLAAVIRKKTAVEALDLAGTGWKKALRDVVQERTDALNTPSVNKIVPLYRECVGLELVPLLGPEAVSIDAFAKKRGEIAHKGAKAGFISIKDLDADHTYICGLVVKIDNFVIAPMKQLMGYQPWNKRP
jgi:hypothetical protein